MSYTGHANIDLDAKVEAIRQCVFEVEHAQRKRERQTVLHAVTIALLAVVFFTAAVAILSL